MADMHEAKSLLRKWDQANRDKEKSLEYSKAIKVYFFSPFIFGERHINSSWIQTVHDNLITNMRGDIPLEHRNKYMIQLDLLERTFSVVWNTVKTTCKEEEGRKKMTELVNFSNLTESLLSVEEVMKNADEIPMLLSMWKELKNIKLAKRILVLCIKYFFELVNLIINKNKSPLKDLQDFPKKTAKKVDDLKMKGNILFQSNRYKKAARYYSQALNIDLYNAVLYCNRAQANLYLGRNWDAFLDAKRATLLDPGWPKAYYRMSQALYELDNLKMAINENEHGQEICRSFQQDTKDLEVQLKRFHSEKDRLNGMEKTCCDLPDKLETVDAVEVESDSEDDDEMYKPILEDPYMLIKEGSKYLRLEQYTGPEGRVVKKLESHAAKQKKEESKRLKETLLLEEKAWKKEVVREKKQQEAEERRRAEKLKEIERKKEEKARQESKKALALERKNILKEGSTAYLEGRGRAAFESYQKVADLMAKSKDKFGGFSEGDLVIFLYALGMAALETGNPELCMFGMDTFDDILKDHPKIRTALPYYGKALAFFKMNRFKEAFDPIEKGSFIAEKFPSTVETWPGTSINIQQTEAGKMVKAMAELKERCKNPPPPDAICRFQHCDTRQEIYVSDVEFKGYVKIHCSDHCKMDYHLNCWKKCRDDAHKKTDKDMLDVKCFTPDCPGILVEIIMFGSDGLETSALTKKEFQHEKVKTKTTSKPTKKENKKSKKGKHKEKGQSDSTSHDHENAAPTEPSVEPSLTPSPPPATDSVENHEETEGAETGVTGETGVTEPIGEKEIQFEDVTDAAHLHQEAAYILKKEEPEPEEKKQPAKPSKSKNKKKKKEQTLELGIDFMDTNERHFISAEDATDPDSYGDAAYNNRPVRSGGQYYQQTQLILLSEDEMSQVLVLHFHFLEILETNGPLKEDDPILTREYEKLPRDSLELIARHGGLASFLMLCDEITMVEDYVCRVCDIEKCNDLLQQKKVVWTQLPQTGTQRHGPHILGPATWQEPHYLSDGNDNSFVKRPKMDCLDSFGDFEAEDKSDGILTDSLSRNDDTFLSEGDSSSPGVYGDMELTHDNLILTKPDGELDTLDLLAKLPPARLSTQQEVNENSSHGGRLLDDDGTYEVEETVQMEFDNESGYQEPSDSKSVASDLSGVSSHTDMGAAATSVNSGTDDHKKKDIHQNVLKSGEPRLGSESSHLETSITNIPSRETSDSSQRCLSGDIGSGESTSSGVGSERSISSVLDMVVKERLNIWKESVRQVLTLCPDIVLEEDVTDEILIRAFNQQFYQHVKQLQAGNDKKLHDKKTNLISVGSLAVVALASRSVNTEPIRTFEREYFEAKAKCDNMEHSLSDIILKYKSLEEVMMSEQNKAKTKHIQQQGVIEELQRKFQQSEERLNQEIRSSQAEKSSLLAMVHEQEGVVRMMQSKLQELENVKKLLDQANAEKDTLRREKEELKSQAEQVGEECRLQKDRAKKAEISIIQIHKDQAVRPLDEAVRECNFHIMNLKHIIDRNPDSTDINLFLKDWDRCLEDNKQKLEKTKEQFDGQMKQLHEGKTLIDLPVIPRPEPSRSKMVKKQPGPPSWPPFGRTQFHPAPGVNGVPLSPGSGPVPIRPPHSYNAPPPPPGLFNSSMSQTVAEDTPGTTSSVATTSTLSTPPPTAFGLPPARGNPIGLLSEPGSTMLLNPGPAGMQAPPGMRLLPNPIGTRHAGGFAPVAPPTTQGGMKEAKVPTTESAALPSKAPQPVPENAGLRGSPGPYNHTNGGATAEPRGAAAPRSSYQRIMDRLSSRFPSYNRIQLTNFLKMVRAKNGNSLSGLSMEDITRKVGEVITENEHAVLRPKHLSDGNGSVQQQVMQPPNAPVVIAPAAPPSKSAWSSLDDTPINWQAEQYDDEVDPCVICHEELAIKDILDLECGHRFHSDCIQEWLGTKSTCPNCRKFTKLKEEYPALTV